MSCLEVFFEHAKATAANGKELAHIVLPEGEDIRVVEGAVKAVELGIAKITLLGDIKVVEGLVKNAGGKVSDFTILNPQVSDKHKKMETRYLEIRDKKTNPDKAYEAVRDALVFGNLMVEMGEADGSIAGATHTTGDTVRAAFQVIGKAEGVASVSSFFLMGLDKDLHGRDDTLIFSDCALTIDPDKDQLAAIAVASADSFKSMLGQEPNVAILSFSTKGSAKHAAVNKVMEAVEIANRDRPDLKIDGEMQFDAAFVESVGALKAPKSSVAGKANVLVFPSLNAGNIGYKIAQRLGGLTATGPVLQGLAKPANDLSRGCDSEDVYNMILVTVNQVYSAR